MKPVVLSWSGGKDSALALQALLADDEHEPVALLTSITLAYDRVSIHGVRRALLEAQAASLGLPLVTIGLEPSCTNAEYESAFLDTLGRIGEAWPDVRHIAFGDLFLQDVRDYRERLLTGTGYEPLFPLWGDDTKELAHRFIRDRFRACVVCVDTVQLDGVFVGRAFDTGLLSELPSNTDPCGERGEFHTFVTDGPIFGRPVECRTGEIVRREDRFAYCDLLPSSVIVPIAGHRVFGSDILHLSND